jgi:hypothetical protein
LSSVADAKANQERLARGRLPDRSRGRSTRRDRLVGEGWRVVGKNLDETQILRPGVPTHWMPSGSRQMALLRDAVEVVMRRLSVLPPSPEVEELRTRAEDCRRQVEGRKQLAPTAAQREAVMKHVLGLHVALSKLERWTT